MQLMCHGESCNQIVMYVSVIVIFSHGVGNTGQHEPFDSAKVGRIDIRTSIRV